MSRARNEVIRAASKDWGVSVKAIRRMGGVSRLGSMSADAREVLLSEARRYAIAQRVGKGGAA